MRACVQCGLSIGETATFCQVCGTRFDAAAAIDTLEATQVSEGPQAGPDTDPGADRWADAEACEPGAELVADIGAEPIASVGSELDADTTAQSASEPEPSTRDRKLAAIAVLLESASGFEAADVSRAAALYQEAILSCLDAAGDPDGATAVDYVDQELLRGFDGLSSLLERSGLAEEALEVVDDAAALGLLDDGDVAASGHRDALRVRREDLRRGLFADSSQL